MLSSRLIALYNAILVVGAVVVGRAAAGAPQATRMTAVGIFLALAAVVIVRPAVAVYVAFGLSVLVSFFPSSTLQVAALPLLIVGIASGLRTSEKSQQIAVLLLFLLTSWVIVFGVVFAPPEPEQRGVAIAFVSATVLAACAIVSQVGSGAVVLYLGSWSLVMAVWVLLHPGHLATRTGSIFAGENADSLGVIIALGTVAFVAYAVERRRILIPYAIVASIVAIRAIIVTGSRGALLALVVGLLVAALAQTWVKRPMKIAVFLLLAIPAAWQAAPWFLSRFLAASGRGIEVRHGYDLRSRVAQLAWDQGIANPLTGIGVGRLHEASISTGGIGVYASAHNTFLGLFAAAGLPALLLLLGLFAVAIGRARRVAPRLGLSMLAVVAASGMSIEWWTSSHLAPLSMLGIALSLAAGRGRASTFIGCRSQHLREPEGREPEEKNPYALHRRTRDILPSTL